MDTTAADIVFDADGACSYCATYDRCMAAVDRSPAARDARLASLVERVKAGGTGRPYDCVVGVSGGIDSSYALLKAVELGLLPLAVHLDNGWNSELSAHNIASLVQTLGVDLHTHVIDWEENRDLQRSFFAAHVVDIELLMDNAMLALNYRLAAKYGLRYILTGSNTVSEGVPIPTGWNHYKYDARNIRCIQRRFGRVPIATHPLISTLDQVWFEFGRRIRWVSFLDYLPYSRTDALAKLQSSIGFKPYPYKHYESVFTRFYQAHILPRKFGFDKRRPHLSALVVSGQMTRDEALTALEQSPYPDPAQEAQDRAFVMKKLGFTEPQFTEYMQASAVPHGQYGSEKWLRNGLLQIARLCGLRSR